MAAEDFRDTGSGMRRSAAFAGANVRLPLGAKVATPTARLQVTMTHIYENRQSASPTRMFKAAGFELGAGANKGATLFMNGRDVSRPKRKLGFNGSSNTLLIVGGVLLAGAAAFLLFAEDGNNAQPAR
jgi:hypothetical protein